jgi:hypothetical protein
MLGLEAQEASTGRELEGRLSAFLRASNQNGSTGEGAMLTRLTLFLATAFLVLSVGQALPATLEGSWSGAGTISYKNSVDKVHCRVRVSKASGSSFAYKSTCATDTGRYELTGTVSSSGGNRYTGTVRDVDKKGGGTVLLILKGNTLSVTGTGTGGSANLTLSRR